MSIEREEQILEDSLEKGEISNAEFNSEMQALRRDCQAQAEEAAQQAYDDVMGSW